MEFDKLDNVGARGIPLLTGSNYPHWKLRMHRILQAKELDDLVYGHLALPTRPEEGPNQAANKEALERYIKDAYAWKKKNATAMTCIYNAIDDKNLTIVQACATAQELWERLESEYADKEPISLEAILTEFYTFKKEPGMSIAEYIGKIEMMVLRMGQLQQSPSNDAVMAKIITGLPEEYINFKRTWDMTPKEFKRMDMLQSNLKKEETALGGSSAPAGALLARSANTKNTQRFKKKPDKSKSKCKWCDQCGHWWKECPKRPKDQVPSGIVRKTKQANTHSNHDESEQRKGLIHKMVVPDQQNGKQRREDLSYEEALCNMMAIVNKANDEPAFYIDSGCSAHFTGKQHWLQGYKPLSERHPIQVGNGQYLYAIGTGYIDCVAPVDKREVPLRLENVYYVPNLSENLFSVGAAMARGAEITFRNDKAYVMDGNRILATGDKAGANLYRLNIKFPMQAKFARTDRTSNEWHNVLGHVDANVIKEMARSNCVDGMRIVEQPRRPEEGCGGCQAGKGKCASHPTSSRPRASEVLERVHMDIVGKISPPSVGKKNYFLLIRDEHSTYLWAEFLESKAEVANKIKLFFERTYLTTQRRIRYMRSDRGSEFDNDAVRTLCEANGITTEFSAVYTPQQNGLAERANQTVIGTARANLQASGLPQKLWAEAVACAVYVRNRLPNTKTGGKTPFEIFYGHKPDVSHMMRFGQPVHIIDYEKSRGKFASKTREAFMVGYGSRVNTYRCMLTNMEDVVITSDCVPATHNRVEKIVGSPIYTTFTIGPEELEQDRNQRVSGGQSQTGESSRTNGDDAPGESARSNEQEIESCEVEPSAPCECLHEDRLNETFDVPRPIRSETFIVEEAPAPSDEQQLVSWYPSLEIAMTRPDFMRKTTQNRPAQLQGEQAPPSQGERVEARPPLERPQAGRSRSQIPPTDRETRASSRGRKEREAAATLNFGQSPNLQTSAESQGSTKLKRSVTLGALERRATNEPGRVSTPRSLLDRVGPAISSMMGTVKNKTSTMMNMVATLSDNREPRTYREAITGPECSDWRAAIDQELMALRKMETWVVVNKPKGVEEITAKWVFKKKLLPDGRIERHKARLVARGFDQREGIDYTEVFAPVVRIDSVRLLFSISAQLGLIMFQFDIATAFLNGIVEEEIYLRPPDGVEVEEGQTLRLKRSLYGLKQSPRCWGARFREVALGYGMRPTMSDPCVYSKEGGRPLFLALYVDDGLIFGASKDDITAFVTYLKKHFQVNEVISSCFIGVEIERSSDGSIFIHQKGYIDRMLERFGMQDCKGAASPLPTGHALNRPEVLEQPAIELPEYAAAVGSLLWCAVSTRPDISYAMSVLSKYVQHPREAHWKAVKRVFRYLKATRDHGLHYAKVDEPELICYSDADWAGDQASRASTSGMVTNYTSGPISYHAQQQEVIALSTTEAEYIAASTAVKDLIWIQRFIAELGIKLESKPRLFCDNQSAIKLVKNPEFHKRSKHIDIRYHFIRNSHEAGLFDIDYVNTEEQFADIFTKALSAEKHNKLKEAISCLPGTHK